MKRILAVGLLSAVLMWSVFAPAAYGAPPISVWTFLTHVFFKASAETYYVCPAALANCAYNGDGGQAATPSDSNACITKALPCATIAGVQSVITGMILDHVVTIQLADSGASCYFPNGVTFDNVVQGGRKYDIFEQGWASYTDAYPNGYLYLHGNDTTPTNVQLVGAATCAGTVGVNRTAVRFVNTNARVSGMQFRYFDNVTNSGQFGNIACMQKAVCFIETINAIAEDNSGSQEIALDCAYHTYCGLAGTWTLNGLGAINCQLASYCETHTPAGYPTVTMTAANWAYYVFQANEWAHFVGWGPYNITFNGTATYTGFFAFGVAGSINIIAPGNVLFSAASITFNNANMLYMRANQGAYAIEACGSNNNNCTFTSGPATYAQAYAGSWVQVNQNSHGNLTTTDGGCIYFNPLGGASAYAQCGDNAQATTRMLGVAGISGATTGIAAKNLRGNCAFSSATTCAVSFANTEADASYFITLSCSANKTFWVTAKGTGGFTINASASSSDNCDWVMIR